MKINSFFDSSNNNNTAVITVKLKPTTSHWHDFRNIQASTERFISLIQNQALGPVSGLQRAAVERVLQNLYSFSEKAVDKVWEVFETTGLKKFDVLQSVHCELRSEGNTATAFEITDSVPINDAEHFLAAVADNRDYEKNLLEFCILFIVNNRVGIISRAYDLRSKQAVASGIVKQPGKIVITTVNVHSPLIQAGASINLISHVSPTPAAPGNHSQSAGFSDTPLRVKVDRFFSDFERSYLRRWLSDATEPVGYDRRVEVAKKIFELEKFINHIHSVDVEVTVVNEINIEWRPEVDVSFSAFQNSTKKTQELMTQASEQQVSALFGKWLAKNYPD